ncbi:TPA: tyrosine-type recombinase/integrase [Streptococcus suis]
MNLSRSSIALASSSCSRDTFASALLYCIYITPHIMRHFFTTQSLIAGARPEDVMHFLGHASLQTTKQYTHIKEERAHNVTDLFDKKVL